jgi:ABC-2 type transport system permease protein
MSATVAPASEAPAKATERAELRKLPAGWRIIAAKEFADHVVSVRFLIVLVVLGLAAAIPLYFASDEIRNAAQSASSVPAVFLLLFTIGPQDINILRVDAFVGIVAPLLGLTFAFDAVNSERAEGTLPRLLSQPIYRDDVINGKFLAGLGVIGIVLVSVVVLIAGFGMFRLGIVPHGPEVPRLIAWVAATFLYVALWLSFGLLLSVVIQRAATAALVGFGVWLLLTIFGQLIVTLVSGIFTPASNATVSNSSAASRPRSGSLASCRAPCTRRSRPSSSTRTCRRSRRPPRSASSCSRNTRSRRSTTRACSRSTRACCSCGRSSSCSWR